jgi:DNA-binding PadR family transcriptional regulator
MSLKYAILGLLADQPRTGYEIQKSFAGSVGYFWEAKFQQIYGELRRLEEHALVKREAVAGRGKQERKVYAITPKGERALDAWLDTPSPLVPVRSEFLVKVRSFGRLPPERALARLREHRRQNEERLEAYRAIQARLAESGVTGDSEIPAPLLGPYLTLASGIGYEEAVVAWCDRAIALVERRLAAR